MTSLRKRFVSAGNIKVTDEDLAKAASMGPSAPKTAPGQMMQMQGLLQTAEDEIRQLKDQLKDATASAEIPLDLIDEVEGRRRKHSPESYAELKANLQKNKLVQPITVRRKGNGRFELIAGHHRTSIYREEGRTTIPAFVVDVADADVERAAFFSNLLAPSLPDFEKYWNFKRLADTTGLTHSAIADAAGISRAHVSRIMKFDALPEAAKAVLYDAPDRLGSNAAEKLAQLAQAGRAEEVTEAIRKLVTDESVTQEQAVALAKPVATPAPQPETHTVKQGKQTYCDITVRKNVIGVRFGKAVSDEDAKRWVTKLAAFMEAEMTKED